MASDMVHSDMQIAGPIEELGDAVFCNFALHPAELVRYKNVFLRRLQIGRRGFADPEGVKVLWLSLAEDRGSRGVLNGLLNNDVLLRTYSEADTDKDGFLSLKEFMLGSAVIVRRYHDFNVWVDAERTGAGGTEMIESINNFLGELPPVRRYPAVAGPPNPEDFSVEGEGGPNIPSALAMKQEEIEKYREMFYSEVQVGETGVAEPNAVKEIFNLCKIPDDTQKEIYAFADTDCDDKLSCTEFIVGMAVMSRRYLGTTITEVSTPLVAELAALQQSSKAAAPEPRAQEDSVAPAAAVEEQAPTAAAAPQSTFQGQS